MYYKVGEPVFIHDWVIDPGPQPYGPFFPSVSLETQVGIVVEKYNTPQFAKQMITEGGETLRRLTGTASEWQTRKWRHKDNIEFSPRAFKSYDVQDRTYIDRCETPKSGRWHKYYVVMIGDEKKIYMYKDLKKMHNQ